MTAKTELESRNGRNEMPSLYTGVQVKWWIAYIGGTVGTLEARVKEHRDASQKGAPEKSALAEHA